MKKQKKCQTIGTIQQSNRKFIETEATLIPLTHMIAQFRGLCLDYLDKHKYFMIQFVHSIR